MLRGTQARVELDPIDAQRFDAFALSYLHVFETLFYQAEVGIGDRKLLAAEENSLKALFSMPGIREWWSQNPYENFSREFHSYVEPFLQDYKNGSGGE